MVAGKPAGAARDRSFAPVVDARTRVLILGSLPGVQSLAARQYYANPRNGFWALVGVVIGVDLRGLAYPDRLAALLSHGIGLWDVIADATRKGSLDSAIRDPRGNDLAALAGGLPRLAAIAFNGGTAARIGQRQLAGQRGATLTLLSSSGACAVRADVKQADWMRLRAYL
jgi:hypoxanthine-DNA glycosylase